MRQEPYLITLARYLLGTQLLSLLETRSLHSWTCAPTLLFRELAVILTALGKARTGITALTVRFGFSGL